MLSFFCAFSLGPKKARFYAATSDFVAISLFPHHGDKCRLLLIEDPALKAQPQQEVVVGVGRNLSLGHDTVGVHARFAKDSTAL